MRLRVAATASVAAAAVFGGVVGVVAPWGGSVDADTQAASASLATRPSGTPSTAGPSTQPPTPNPANTPSTEGTPSPEGPIDTSSVAASNGPQPQLPITKLKPGEQPPQFVVVSFDGACGDDLFKHWLETANRNDARFTFFLSGLCLVPDKARFEYKPPLKKPGTSAIGFGEASFIPDRIKNLTVAYNSGQEIGSHALGHFCGPGGVGNWNSAQWTSEVNQFNKFLDTWRPRLGSPLADGVGALPFNSSVIKGIRTPCLEGKRSRMLPVFAKFGYTYDASNTGTLQWPAKDKYGLWEFPLQTIKIAGFGRSAISMDYNMMCVQNKCSNKASPAETDKIRASTKATFDNALKAVCRGNRAPLFIGNHFNLWVNGAYKTALTDFVDGASEQCSDVRFVSNSDLQKWLDAQDPAVRNALRAKGSQGY